MNGKIIRCLAIAAGLLLYGAAFYLYDNFTNMPNIIYVADGNFYKENNFEATENKYVMLTGKISTVGVSEDKEFGVTSNYPVMDRKVELYQYFLDEKDGKKVAMRGWKGTKIKDFKAPNGKEYKNPPFPKDIKDAKFFADFVINGGNLPVSNVFFRKLWQDEKYKDKIYYLIKLPEKCAKEGFELKKNHYLKPGDKKNNIGSIRVYYKVLNNKLFEMPEVTVVGRQIDGKVMMQGEECRFFDKIMTLDEVRQTYNEDAPHAAFGAVLFGTFFVLLGVFKERA